MKIKIKSAPAVLFQPVHGKYLITDILYNSSEEAKRWAVRESKTWPEDCSPGDYFWVFWYWPAKFEDGMWTYEGEDYSDKTYQENLKMIYSK